MKKKYNKILVIRFSSLGDIVLTTPLFKKLKRAYPNATVDIVVKKEFQDIVIENPHINTVHAFDNSKGFAGLRAFIQKIKQEKYDLYIDLHRSLRSRILLFSVSGKKIKYSKDTLRRIALLNLRWNLYHTMPRKIEDYLTPLKQISLDTTLEATQMLFSDQDLQKAQNTAIEIFTKKISQIQNGYTKSTTSPIIGIAPGAAHFLKKWPLEKYKELVYLLYEKFQAMFYVFGGPQDIECDHLGDLPLPIVNLQGKLSLKQTAALISKCEILIGNDSGLSHVAEAVDTDAFVFFGPTTRHFGYAPYRKTSHVFEKELTCRPCSRNGRGKCKNKSLKKCLEDISSTEVAQYISEYFQK